MLDDDKEDQNLVIMALEKDCEEDEYEIITYSCHEIFLNFIKSDDFVKKYSPVILLDIKMPNKDGYEILSIIKRDEMTMKFPVVVFSSTQSKEEIEKCYNLGANSFIEKKIDFDELVKSLKEFKNYWIKTARKP